MFISQNLLALGQIVGGGIQAAAQFRQAKREKESFEFNAGVLQRQAQLIQAKAKLDIERQRADAQKFISSQTAAFAAAGVRLTGSPLEVLRDSASELELDILITDFNSKIDVLNALTESKFQLQKAQIAKNTGFIKAGASLLSVLPTFGKLQFKSATPKAITQQLPGGVSSESFGGISDSISFAV